MTVLVETENTPQAWSRRAGAPTSWQAAGWSEAGQVRRFLAVLGHIAFRPGDRLFDFGCGTGAFCEYLPYSVDYLAYDWSEAMRERCAADHARARVLGPGEAWGAYDHVVAVGPFNLPGSKEETWATLERLWQHTTRTLVVSLYRGEDASCLRYTPSEVTGFAEDLSARYVVDASYLPNDLLMVAHR